MGEMSEKAAVKWTGIATAFVLAVFNVIAAVVLLVGFIDVLWKSNTSYLVLYAAGAAAMAAGIGAIVAGIVQVARARINGCWLLAGGSGCILIPELVMVIFLASSDSTGVGAVGNTLALLGGLIVLSILAIAAATMPVTRRNVQLRAA